MENAPSFVVACQTYEGGLGGEPGNEAHGGYAFCGLAAMVIMKQTHLLNIQNLAVRTGTPKSVHQWLKTHSRTFR
jgi:protein farnesyltransferase subunit beta